MQSDADNLEIVLSPLMKCYILDLSRQAGLTVENIVVELFVDDM